MRELGGLFESGIGASSASTRVTRPSAHATIVIEEGHPFGEPLETAYPFSFSFFPF